MAVDGAINGTRKMNAAAPAFLTSVTTPSLTSPAATNLTLGTGTSGAAITVLSASNKVGILTVTPAAVLEIGGASANTDFRISRTVSPSTFFSINAPGGSPSTATFGVSGTDILSLNSTSVTIANSTAGSAGAGALVVTGGLSAGGASYFGANVVARGALGYATGIHSGATTDSGQQLILSSSGAYSNAYVSKSGTTLGIGFSSSNGSFVEDHALSIVAATKAATFAGAVTIAGTVIHTLSATPASASATGTVGTMSWDASYIYICTATNTWKRVAIATW